MNLTNKTSGYRASSAALRALALMTCSAAAMVAMSSPAAAQDVTSGIVSGTVSDDKGAAIEGATVTVSSESRATSQSLSTNSDGTFRAIQLPLGNYKVTIAKEGYQTLEVASVPAQLGGSAFSFTLPSLATGEQAIVVTGKRTAALDFSQAAVGVVFDVQDIARRVPVARSVQQLQLLAPQAIEGDPTFDAGTDSANGAVSLGGSSLAENIFYINGMNITNFRTFVGGSAVPFEFYDQVQVKTGGYSAEFGRATGGAVIAVTRSGSNTFQGGANFVWDVKGLTSKSPNSYINDNSRDERNAYEGNVWLSGPIWKDHIYFFGFFNPRFQTSLDWTRSDTGEPTFQNSRVTSNEPFYGGKIDADLFPGHRLEFTYFNDYQQEKETAQVFDSATKAMSSESDNTVYSGGENMVAKYTGRLADFITVSALWGKSEFAQTSAGSADNLPYVGDGRSGTLTYVQGNPNLLIEVGQDKREFYRGDVDLFFKALGEHHVRFGVDHEILTASSEQIYSGGKYYRYYKAGASGAFSGAVAPGGEYVRVRTLNSGGTFQSKNTAFYIQDSWDLTSRLNLSLGVRNDRFQNLNASGNPFTDIKNQWAPRLGVTYDLFGDKRTALRAFFGRYYLPVAANTNLRMAGNEKFIEDYYLFTGPITSPTLGTNLAHNVLSDSNNASPITLVSENLTPQHLDEYIVGAEHRFADRWKVGVNLIHRKLKSVLEDTDLNQYAARVFCATQSLSGCNATTKPSFGSGGFVLVNPGKDVIVSYEKSDGTFQKVTIPKAIVGLPEAKRDYWAVELTFDRQFDGVWSLSGSYVWSKNKGNYEGGVRSENAQTDTGLTQDFDRPGWTDGSYGNLPNDRRHIFKVFGSYAVTPDFTVGVNARLSSPRSFSCLGIYPFREGTPPLYNDGRAKDPYLAGGADSYYCGDRSKLNADGSASASILVPRGSAFKGAWQKNIDLSLQYELKSLPLLKSVVLRADVFNVLNFDDPTDYREYGDIAGVISQTGSTVSVPLDPNYQKPTSFQRPRSVRLSASMRF